MPDRELNQAERWGDRAGKFTNALIAIAALGAIGGTAYKGVKNLVVKPAESAIEWTYDTTEEGYANLGRGLQNGIANLTADGVANADYKVIFEFPVEDNEDLCVLFERDNIESTGRGGNAQATVWSEGQHGECNDTTFHETDMISLFADDDGNGTIDFYRFREDAEGFLPKLTNWANQAKQEVDGPITREQAQGTSLQKAYNQLVQKAVDEYAGASSNPQHAMNRYALMTSNIAMDLTKTDGTNTIDDKVQ